MRNRPTARVVRRRLGFGGLVGAVSFLCASLTPSLLPRSWIMQGVIGGVSAALGYGLFGLLAAGIRRLVRVRPSVPTRRIAWLVLSVGGSALCLGTLWRSTIWQRDLRRSMGLDGTLGWLVPLIPVVAIGVFLAMLFVARVIRLGGRKLTGALTPFVPFAGASLLSTAVIAVLVVVLVNDFLFRGFVGVVDVSSSHADVGTERGVTRPSSPYLSGSPSSLVSWDSLGRYGRGFVGAAVRRSELARFAGRSKREWVAGPVAKPAKEPVKEPIRVYTGLRSAASYPEQADLAVRELVRVGAFRRRVLAVMATTGTGWVNGNAADALELMYGGDSAMVAMQYSYLPSWVSFLVDRSKAVRATRALVQAVHAQWERLPPRRRPTLVVFGESLGAFGIEKAYGDLGRLTARTDGALLVGPPGFNPIWSALTTRRDRGSPLWRPVYRRGQTVRFAQRPADLAHPLAPWRPPRVVYLQNASDPVVWWSPTLIYRRPDWLEDPRGPGVSRQMRWFPLVTFCQVVVDLIVARGMPPGRGHRYGANVVDGWAAIASPPGWTAADTARLRVRIPRPRSG